MKCTSLNWLTSTYSLNTKVMLILVLIDVQYLQNVGFCIEKDSDAHNHFLSDSHHLITLTLTHSPQFFQRMLKVLNCNPDSQACWFISWFDVMDICPHKLYSMNLFFTHFTQGFPRLHYGETTICKGRQKAQGFQGVQGISSKVSKIKGCFNGLMGLWPP